MVPSNPVHLPSPNVEINHVAIPAALTQIIRFSFRLYDMEIVNTTTSPITLTCWDCQAEPLLVIPTTSIGGQSVLTYTRHFGRVVAGGLCWQASAPGLYGNIQGQRL
jgi:hypothetical protein